MPGVMIELQISKKADVIEAVEIMRQLKPFGISRYIIPDHFSSKIRVAEAARALSSHGKIVCTATCRGIKSIADAQEKYSWKWETMAVTGDQAQPGDISIFGLIGILKKPAAAIVFSRKNEAERMAKKSDLGVKSFFSQPVFPGNVEEFVNTMKKFRQARPGAQCKIAIGCMVPFKARLCKKLAREKTGFITDTGFIKGLGAAEKEGRGYEETIRIAREHFNTAKRAESSIRRMGFKTALYIYGIRRYQKIKGNKIRASQMLKQMKNAQI